MNHSTTRKQIQKRLQENSGAESLLQASMSWMEPLYDPVQGLLRYPQNPEQHMVRESLWFAFGLVLQVRFFARNESDLIQAENIAQQVLANQYDVPGEVWHGTFKRAPQEPDPPAPAVMWKDYDPNWRQFIGTVLLLWRKLEGDLMPASLQAAIDSALKKCIEGEPVNRVPVTYTNIALMKAWLEVECGELIDDQGRRGALEYADDIAQRFSQHNAFQEYNSPTYYGINFFALGLWQNFSADLSSMGRRMSVALWEDVARYYHADMKNLCGPWSRSYGMDMQQYVAALGLWIWAATNRNTAPLPESTDNLQHAHDFCLGPIAAFSATLLPDGVTNCLNGFHGERHIQQQISDEPHRSVEAYLSKDIMLGLESSSISFHGTDQYHPFTIHWLDEHGQVHWCRMRFKGRVEGELGQRSVTLRMAADEGVNTASLEFSDAIQLNHHTLHIHGLALVFDTDCHLSADLDNLTIELNRSASTQILSFSYELEGQFT